MLTAINTLVAAQCCSAKTLVVQLSTDIVANRSRLPVRRYSTEIAQPRKCRGRHKQGNVYPIRRITLWEVIEWISLTEDCQSQPACDGSGQSVMEFANAGWNRLSPYVTTLTEALGSNILRVFADAVHL
jgi:hypothetical protein